MRKKLVILGFACIIFLLPVHAFAATVIIDAGHGGHDPGAIGVNGLKEKDVNLDIAQKLKNELQLRGYEAIMTRETDHFLSLQQRVDIARRVDGDLFVSIHANSYKNKNVRGSLILYYDDRYPQAAYPASKEMALLTDESYALAAEVLESMLVQTQTENRGLVPSSVFVTRNGRVPSILVESAFLSNADDAALLASDSFRARVAAGIADGIGRYEIPPFFDLARHWAKEPVLRLENLGVVNGYRHEFNPNGDMTRAEFMTLLDQVFSFEKMINELGESGLPANPETSGETTENAGTTETAGTGSADTNPIDNPIEEPLPYPDIEPDHWAYAALEKAVKLGLLTGYEDGTLRPDRPVSRAEMVAVFDRIAMKDLSGDENAHTFKDVPSDSWYGPSVGKMVQQGWIKGKTESTFAPEKSMTRAEGAAVLERYLDSPLGMVVRQQLEMRQSAL